MKAPLEIPPVPLILSFSSLGTALTQRASKMEGWI